VRHSVALMFACLLARYRRSLMEPPKRVHKSGRRSLTGTSPAAETTLRPGPIANRPQDAILPYIWHQQNQQLACGFLESVNAARTSPGADWQNQVTELERLLDDAA
jgi:hypothetical protein